LNEHLDALMHLMEYEDQQPTTRTTGKPITVEAADPIPYVLFLEIAKLGGTSRTGELHASSASSPKYSS
jgi:hypothetical protein